MLSSDQTRHDALVPTVRGDSRGLVVSFTLGRVAFGRHPPFPDFVVFPYILPSRFFSRQSARVFLPRPALSPRHRRFAL